jgi:hypothetical protein
VVGDPRREDREREAPGDDEDDGGEVGDLVQVDATLSVVVASLGARA